jgi:hypothetical protein
MPLRNPSTAAAGDSLESAAQSFVEDGTNRAFHFVSGNTYNSHASGDNAGIGMGFRLLGTGSFPSSGSSVLRGGLNATTGTSSGGTANLAGGGQLSAALDFTIGVRTILESEANGHFFIGLSTNSHQNDSNGMIGIRVTGTGNIFGYTDNAGTETTRDSSITPDGSTEHTLRIEITGGGTSIAFFVDDTKFLTSITTNIPAGTELFLTCGQDTTSTVDTDAHFMDYYAWSNT